MIKINEDFSFDRGDHCWQLHHAKDGFHAIKKTPTRSVTTTYYGSVEQVCKAVIDRESGVANSLEELMAVITKTKQEIVEAINGSQINIRENNTDTPDPE